MDPAQQDAAPAAGRLGFDGPARDSLAGRRSGAAAALATHLLHRQLGVWPDLSAFDGLVGSAGTLLIYLALSWVLAAFGEEMVWRGYALPRAWILALVVVNVAFGLAHLYQGASGVVQATVAGVLLGILYVATGSNLVAPILAHGISNSIDFTVMYAGHYPGVGT